MLQLEAEGSKRSRCRRERRDLCPGAAKERRGRRIPFKLRGERALLRQIYDTEVDLIPDLKAKTLTVRLHHLTQAAHDHAVRYPCEELTATETIFPGTDLRLVYKLGST